MKIVKAYPPNIDDIHAAFGVRSQPGIVFTYGDTIYSPQFEKLEAHLIAHEEVHALQQAAITPEAWWERYLVDPQFRLEQEVEAYKVQYKYLQTNYNRKQRKEALKHISADLAGSMYGNIVDKELAKVLITGDSNE